MARDYLKHEEFIWKDLIARAELAVQQVRERWRKERRFPRTVISWPAESLETDDGKKVEMVTLAIPDGVETNQALIDMVKRTKPYGLLLVESTKDELRIILESPHGARCWKMAIRRHGDVRVLEKETATADRECLGLLWRRSTASG